MKRIVWVLAGLLLISGCSSEEPKAPAKGKIEEVKAADVMKRLDDKETMLLVVGTSTCGSCIEFDKVMKEYIQENKVTFVSLKIDDEPTVKNSEGQEVRQNYLDLQERIGKVSVTPTILLIVNGEVKAMESGGWDKKELKQIVKDFNDFKKALPLVGKVEYKSSAEVMQSIQSGSNMILVIGNTTCSSCIHFRKTIHTVLETQDVTITEVLVDKEPRKQNENGDTILPDFEQLENIIGEIKGTPTTFRIENGLIVNSLYGAVDESELKTFLEGYAS